jgi:phosphoribosyl-AMP cyclohydrolase
VQDASTGEVLMVAFMDREALAATRHTGLAHFHSRSRGRLWKKGETSGHVLRVERILVDCDQDAIVLKVTPAGPACHTGARSCFYRSLDGDGLTRLDE